MTRALIAAVTAAIFLLCTAGEGIAQEPTPVPAPTAVPTPIPTETLPNERGSAFLGELTGSTQFANGEEGDTEAGDTPDDEPPPPIEPSAPAGRASQVVSVIDEPCAVWSDGSGSLDGGAVAPLGAEEQAVQDAAHEAARRESEGATSEEILDAINGGGADPMRDRSTKGTIKAASRQTQEPESAEDNQPINVAAVVALLEQVAADLAAATAATSSPIGGDPGRTCDVPYMCGAERVDDIFAGHIDSEADGVYYEYVHLTAQQISDDQAGIRASESRPPGGAEPPTISDPASPERVQSLAGELADIGLENPPSDLHLPVFNYCRIGADGTIEIDRNADPRVLPLFTWTALEDEFDLPSASANIYDQITRDLNANLPDMRTIPPIEKAVTIVQFPMWLWLNEPFTSTQFHAFSELNIIQMRGLATFHHVTWTLGEHEITCTLDEMKPYPQNARLDQVEHPPCLHKFTQLETYHMTAAVTYRIQQQLSTRRSTTQPFPETQWEPHPINEFVTIESTAGPIRVTEIRAVNVPLDYESSELFDEIDPFRNGAHSDD